MNTALLTIDDFSSSITSDLVDYLIGKGIRPVFFATGMNVERNYDQAVYAIRKGMIVGNHSYSHPAFSTLSAEEGIEEIEKCEQVLNRLYRDSGAERTWRPFRFPYGDKGGPNKDALQQYLRTHGFHKVDDTHLPYPWWKENGLDADIDTFWTFDFGEYMIRPGSDFNKDSVWRRMHDPAPAQGGVLFAPGNRHIILMHDHPETEAMLPGYYRLFIDHLLENGLTFDEPRFL